MRSRILTLFVLAAVLLTALPLQASAVPGQRTYGYVGVLDSDDARFVAADKFGNVFVSDSANVIRKYSSAGSVVATFGATGTEGGRFAEITALACDRWGRVYVADRQVSISSRVQVFDGRGRFLYKLGGLPIRDNLVGLAVSQDGRVYGSSGALLDTINRWTPDVDRDFPDASWTTTVALWDLSCDPAGNVLAGTLDSFGSLGGNVVKAYTPTGTPVASFGSAGTGPGFFNAPAHLDVDAFGQAIVGDSNNNVQVFGPDYAFRTLMNLPMGNPLGISAGRQRQAHVVAAPYGVCRYETTQTTQYSDIAGVHRYNTAVKVSRKAFPYGADTVVFATGLNFPDALGAAALAGALDGSLLLSADNSCPG